MQIDPRILGYLFDRKIRCAAAQIEGSARMRKGGNVHLVQIHKSNPFFIWREGKLTAISAAQVEAFVGAIQFATGHHAASVVIEAVPFEVEAGIFTLSFDKSNRATAGLHHINPRFGGICRAHGGTGTVFAEYQHLTIVGIDWIAVIAWVATQFREGANIQLQALQGAGSAVIMSNKNQRFSIGRKSRFELKISPSGQTLGGARRQVFFPQVAHGIEYHVFAIRGSYGIADHFGVKVGRIQGLFEANCIINPLIDLAGERNFDGLVEAIYVHLIDFAIGPNDDGLVIRRPGEAGITTKDGPGFLLVFGQLVVNRPFASGFQVADVQHRLGAHPPHVGQQFSAARYLWSYGTACTTRNGFHFPGFPIELFNRKNLVVGVFVVLEKTSWVDVFTVINVAAIR